MKTNEEAKQEAIIKYVDETYPECSPESRVKICMQIFAKEYANAKLDEAAEKATLIYESDSTGKISHYGCTYGTETGDVKVDKQSILSIKDKI